MLSLPENLDDTEKMLQDIARLSRNVAGWDREMVKEFIAEGEFGLALDNLAFAYNANSAALTPRVIGLFHAAAKAMEMQAGDEWKAVATLRARHQAPGP